MASVFSDQRITILRGNGFYYKYIPVGLKSGSSGDDNYIKGTFDGSKMVLIYAYYSRIQGAKTGLLTGTTYVFTEATTTVSTLLVQKSRYYGNTPNLTLYTNGKP